MPVRGRRVAWDETGWCLSGQPKRKKKVLERFKWKAGGCWGHSAQWFTVSSGGQHTVAGMRGTSPDTEEAVHGWLQEGWRASSPGAHVPGGRFPGPGGGMLAASKGGRGIRIRRCAFAPGKSSTPSGPLAGTRYLLCCAWVERCAGASGIICPVQAGSPDYRMQRGVCLGERLTGQLARCCVALRWRNLK